MPTPPFTMIPLLWLPLSRLIGWGLKLSGGRALPFLGGPLLPEDFPYYLTLTLLPMISQVCVISRRWACQMSFRRARIKSVVGGD
jgi:hypothetical protein